MAVPNAEMKCCMKGKVYVAARDRRSALGCGIVQVRQVGGYCFFAGGFRRLHHLDEISSSRESSLPSLVPRSVAYGPSGCRWFHCPGCSYRGLTLLVWCGHPT